MRETFAAVPRRPWMGVFLRIVAILYAFGGLVHIANILGFGEGPWLDGPLSWRIADVVYGLLDAGVVIGLWLRTAWGVKLFLLTAASQLVLYGFFPHVFAFTEEHPQGLQSMIVFHAVTLGLFAGLALTRK